MPSLTTFDRHTLELVAGLEVLRALPHLQAAAQPVDIRTAPDTVIVQVQGGKVALQAAARPELRAEGDLETLTLRIPATLWPTDAIGGWHIDLFGTNTAQLIVGGGGFDGTPEAWAAIVASIRARNAALGLRLKATTPVLPSGPARMPSALAPVPAAFHSTRTPIAERTVTLRRRHRVDRLPVPGTGLISKTRQQITVDLQAGRPLQVHLPFERVATGPVQGDRADLIPLCLERLAQLDTHVLADLLALIDVAQTRNTNILAINTTASHAEETVRKAGPRGTTRPAIVAWGELGRRRGWDDLTKHGRYGRLKESVDLLLHVHFTIDLLDGKGTRLENVPLFTRIGDVVRKGHQLGAIVQFNPLLWSAMVEDRRAIVYDRAILTADLRHQEWPFRIYLYLCSRWSRSWQAAQLYQHDGHQMHRLGTILDGAGLDYRGLLDKQGAGWLRRRVAECLDLLAGPKWDGRPLIRKWTSKPDADDLLDDAITVWPTASVAAELNGMRGKAITATVTRTEDEK